MVLNCIIKTKLKDRGHNVKIEKNTWQISVQYFFNLE